MAYLSGTAGSVTIVYGGTAMVGGVREWTLDMGQDTPETTVFGDGWRTFINGLRTFTGALTMLADPANVVQGTIRSALIGGSAPFEFRFYHGTNYYNGSAIPTGMSPGIAYDGVGENSFDIQGTGPLSYV